MKTTFSYSIYRENNPYYLLHLIMKFMLLGLFSITHYIKTFPGSFVCVFCKKLPHPHPFFPNLIQKFNFETFMNLYIYLFYELIYFIETDTYSFDSNS